MSIDNQAQQESASTPLPVNGAHFHPAARGVRSSWFVECADRVMLSVDGGAGRYRIFADNPEGPMGVWVVSSFAVEIGQVPELTDADGVVDHPFGEVINTLRFNS